MSKYTPGPWRVGLDGRFILDGDTYIAEVLQRKTSDEETAANAALLAAAPELFEALADMTTWGRNQQTYEKAQAALTKAQQE